MTQVHRILKWASLATIGALIVLSIIGAFLGAERAGVMFNSIPLALFWLALAALLITGVIVSPSLLRRGGVLAMHVGVLAILAGGMWGSQAGHNLRARIKKPGKVRKGFMALSPGQRTNGIRAADGRTVLGRLPFEIKLEEFRVERYQPEDPPQLWRQVVHPGVGHDRELIKWEIGAPADVPMAGAKMRVLQFYPSARIVQERRLQVRLGDEMHTFRVTPGAELELSDGRRITVVRIFRNLTLMMDNGEILTVDRPDKGSRPAVEVRVDSPDGASATKHLYAEPTPPEPPRNNGLSMHYVVTRVGEALANSLAAACKLEVTRGTESIVAWVFLEADEPAGALPLTRLFPSIADWRRAGEPAILLVRTEGRVRDWIARLAVLRDGKVVARKDVEVNHPLHYGGYHFYQRAADRDYEQYTVLSVVSDDGMIVVYAGFILLAGGAVWTFYIAPLWRLGRRGQRQ